MFDNWARYPHLPIYADYLRTLRERLEPEGTLTGIIRILKTDQDGWRASL